ncbi:MAG: hypothetical protein JWR61_846 [Ferruginibacter sp.]|nr:hypothetical protein [Ferruginibacter sp.]
MGRLCHVNVTMKTNFNFWFARLLLLQGIQHSPFIRRPSKYFNKKLY